MSIKVSSLDEKNSVAASLNASAWGGKLDAAMAQEKEKTLLSYSHEINISKFGGAAKPLPLGLSEVVNEWQNFPSVAKANPLPTTAFLRPYSDISGESDLIDLIVGAKLDKISRLVNLFKDYRRAMAELNRAEKEYDLFYPPLTPGEIIKLSQACDAEMVKIKELAKKLDDGDPDGIDISVIQPVGAIMPNSPSLMRVTEQHVTVGAKASNYFNVGLENEIEIGELLEFETDSNQKWSLGAGADATTDADGFSYVFKEFGVQAKQPQVRFGRLIGRIGPDPDTGVEFEIGKKRKLRARDKGRLMMMCNDAPNHLVGFKDNSGEIVVKVTHRRRP